MFVRKNKNRSGTVSVQIVSKSQGRVKILRTVGISGNPKKVEKLVEKAKIMLPELVGQESLLPLTQSEDSIRGFLEEAQVSVHTVGPELVFGKLFDRIGFNQIEDDLFRHLVVARLAFPGSKLKTVDYPQRYRGINLSVDQLYRFLDRLQAKYQEEVEKIAFRQTQKVLGDLNVVFYDLTTLYFESSSEDDLRKIGFSKDGKFNHPQIMLGLLVGPDGYPIGYDLFKGNTFEGHTLIPFLERFEQKFELKQPVVVADAAMLSNQNIAELEEEGYEYILGARIKNESQEIKDQIFEHDFSKDKILEIYKEGPRLIVNYSDKRAQKDFHNRRRGLRRLEKKLKSGKLTKAQVNQRGYNKYLKLEGKVKVTIDYEKFEKDGRWDGLKGYLTNAALDSTATISNYQKLWQIEKAFRISKTDLRIRPIYHRLQNRIKAHLCICFVAYTIYKELERILYASQAPFSVQRAVELTHTIYELKFTRPKVPNHEHKILKTDPQQDLLLKIINKN